MLESCLFPSLKFSPFMLYRWESSPSVAFKRKVTFQVYTVRCGEQRVHTNFTRYHSSLWLNHSSLCQTINLTQVCKSFTSNTTLPHKIQKWRLTALHNTWHNNPFKHSHFCLHIHNPRPSQIPQSSQNLYSLARSMAHLFLYQSHCVTVYIHIAIIFYPYQYFNNQNHPTTSRDATPNSLPHTRSF